ncbi:MAG: hypothetical protein OES84_00820 [Kiritimatiellaceae bacterium]|nr:hypothetical protein [Kiritimatiellaceae bacterium]
MSQLFAVVLEKDKERVTEALLRAGVMQFLNTSELAAQTPDKQEAIQARDSGEEITDLRKRVEGLLHTIGTIPAPPKESDLSQRVSVNIQEESIALDKLDAEREGFRERQRVLQQEILKLEDVQRQVKRTDIDLSDVKLPAKQSLLIVRGGKFPQANVKHLETGLKNLAALNVPLGETKDVAQYLLISMKRDRDQINKILSEVGWTDISLSDQSLFADKEIAEEFSAKLKALTDEQDVMQNKITQLVKKEESSLIELWRALRILELCTKIQGHFNSSVSTVIFAGWLPRSKAKNLDTKISNVCDGRCYLEWHDAESKDVIGKDVPVQLKNPSLLAPFQMLVSNFGVPQYGTIDPTLFVMPLYLAMFGIMFADVGQGLVLALLGAWGVSVFKKQKEKAGLARLSCLIIWCGLSSMVFGALFGSYFGAALFKPLWFNFHGIISGHSSGNPAISNVYDILFITILFGIAVITLGLLFNWINLIRTKNWADLIFDKGGMLGGWIYGGGIYIIFYMTTHNYKEFPPAAILWLLAGLPSVLLFFKAPYFHLRHHKGPSAEKENLVFLFLNFCMEWIVELLEIFSGYLSNTLSFMRVAGLGIAHVCLMISFFTLAEMTSGIFSILILILGNVLVIGLEGLSAGIQALRLNYYEFFTKFFHGTGKLHTPITLNSEL